MYADVSSGARGLNFGLSLHLLTYFVYARNDSSGETTLMHMLVNVISSKILNYMLAQMSLYILCLSGALDMYLQLSQVTSV